LALAAVLVTGAGPASAHPLGNFTVNTYSGLRIQPDRVVVDLVVDMAEIPTVQAKRTIDSDSDGKVSDTEGSAYAAQACPDLARKLNLQVDGRQAPLRSLSAEVAFPAGAAGLATLRLTCALATDTGEIRGDRTVEFTSSAYTDRVGWREITAVGDRTTVAASDVRPTSTSNRLTTYPNDLLSSPLDQRTATVRVRPGGPAAPEMPGAAPGTSASQPRGIDAATRSFTALVARQHLSLGFGALALALAVGLGAIHAFAPGHGKTMMAAYLVGQRGSLRQAGVIGLTVTATHTVGVLLLGIVLSASTTLAPESLYPWLGLASGLMLATLGASLLVRAVRHRPLLLPAGATATTAELVHVHAEAHVHSGALVGGGDGATAGRRGHADVRKGDDGAGHRHPDGDGDGGHSHGGRHHTHPPIPAGEAMQWRTLVPLGLAGGFVPSPSAIVVLLGAIALGRAWFGVVLVVGYGLGMAATLTGAGLLLVGARGAIENRLSGPRASRLVPMVAALPALTAVAIIAGGVYLAFRGAIQL
jgi:ABC-type nickel/cobalt efflux system permease component RcnA